MPWVAVWMQTKLYYIGPFDSQRSTLRAQEVAARGSQGVLSGCRATRCTAEAWDGGGGCRQRSN